MALLLVKIRHDHHWTQGELGYELGRDFGVGAIARQSISNWERGTVRPPLYLVGKIEALAGINPLVK